MAFSVHAVLLDNSTVFDGTMDYIPRIDEEIDVNGCVLVVRGVRYIIKDGEYNDQLVRLLLDRVQRKKPL